MNGKRCVPLRLAKSNLRHHSRLFLPFWLISGFCCALFYSVVFLAGHPAMSNTFGGDVLTVFLRFGEVILAGFAVIIISYANSFQMRRRSRELALLKVIGLERRHMSALLRWEFFFSWLICTMGGLALGVGFSGGLLALLAAVSGVSNSYPFYVSLPSFALTAALMLLIFAYLLLVDTVRAGRIKPVEQLRESRAGQKEPRCRPLLTILGLLSLGGGYWLALTVDDPVSATYLFFLAVVLVIIGTCLLFSTGSVALLKALRKNPKIYYHPRRFPAIGGLLYRMKQNALGLAAICILSTMMLVTVTTTTATYLGSREMLELSTPAALEVDIYGEEGIDGELLAQAEDFVAGTAAAEGFTGSANGYLLYLCWAQINGDVLLPQIDGRNDCVLAISRQAYQELGYELPGDMKDDGVLLCGTAWQPGGDTVILLGKSYPAAWMRELPAIGQQVIRIDNTVVLVLPEEADILSLQQRQLELQSYAESVMGVVLWDGSDAEGQLLVDQINKAGEEETHRSWGTLTVSRSTMQEECNAVYGGLLFLGLFLGVLFLAGAVLVLYYKQISEGIADRERFAIMQRVGMSRKEARRSIRSQMRIVFFLPLLMAGLHMAFAYSMINVLLNAIFLSNHSLFLIVTVGVYLIFAVVYWLIYRLTAYSYEKLALRDQD